MILATITYVDFLKGLGGFVIVRAFMAYREHLARKREIEYDCRSRNASYTEEDANDC